MSGMLHLQFYDDVPDSKALKGTQYSGYELVQQSV
jgi:hypothetical protein